MPFKMDMIPALLFICLCILFHEQGCHAAACSASASAPCCLGSKKGDSCNSGAGVCRGKDGATGSDLTCRTCGLIGYPCCAGSNKDDACASLSVGNGNFPIGYCAGNDGATGSDLMCTNCGTNNQPCCPGSVIGTSCNYGFGSCTGEAGVTGLGLTCAYCGTTGVRCCLGSNKGDSCDGGIGFCDGEDGRTGFDLLCIPCTLGGQLCCPGQVRIGNLCYETSDSCTLTCNPKRSMCAVRVYDSKERCICKKGFVRATNPKTGRIFCKSQSTK